MVEVNSGKIEANYLAGACYAIIIFHDMALKGPALFVCLREFDCEHLKNNAIKSGR